MPDKPTVFISYRREGGADLARYLHDKLTDMGADVFFDVESIPSGERFAAMIEREIILRDTFLIILKPDTLDSEWVRREALLALKHRKQIIPLVTKEYDFYKNIPPDLAELSQHNAVEYDFRTPKVALKRIAQSLFPNGRAKNTASFSTSNRPMLYGGFALLGLAAVLLVVIVIQLISPSQQDAVFNIAGDNTTIINNSVVEQLTINQGDSPEEIARKKRDRANYLAAEVMQYVRNLDGILTQIDTGVGAEVFDEGFTATLESVRATQAPAIVEAAQQGYQRLITESQAGGLRANLNTYPLPNAPNPAFVGLALDAGIDPYSVQFMYSQLGDVQWAADQLLQTLQDAARLNTDDPEHVEYQQNSLVVAMETVRNRSEIAYVAAQRVFNEIEAVEPNTMIQLSGLNMLEADRLTEAEITSRINEAIEAAGTLYEVRALIIEDGRLLRDADLAAYAEINTDLIIDPQDSWNLVIAKAISLRQLGRVTEALAAFGKYGEMFAADDPTAEKYASTAQRFTVEMASLGVVDGAAYLFQVNDGSTAHEAGLQVGDIVIAYNGLPIRNNDDMREALNNTQDGGQVVYTVLRLSAQDGFQELEISLVKQGQQGVGFMPV